MLKWFVKDFSVKDQQYHVIGVWPNGFAVQVNVGLTEDIKSVLNKINEASAVSYIQLAQGFLMGDIRLSEQDTIKGQESGIQVGTGTGDSQATEKEKS